MKQGLKLLDAAVAGSAALEWIEGAVEEARDLTPLEAAELLRLTTQLQCHALEIQRIALGIPKPKRG